MSGIMLLGSVPTPAEEPQVLDQHPVGQAQHGEPQQDRADQPAGIPATSQILGKADHLLRVPGGEVVTSRQLIEAIESLPAEPWPARYRATACDGRIRLTLPASAIAGYGEAEARRHFAAAGLDADLDIVGNDQATSLRHTRSDMHETTFASQHALVGA